MAELTWSEVRTRIEGGEDEHTEFKLWAGFPRKVANELLAHFMTVMGWMELRGRGLPIIRREMREFNGTEPRLENSLDGRYVRLSLKV